MNFVPYKKQRIQHLKAKGQPVSSNDQGARLAKVSIKGRHVLRVKRARNTLRKGTVFIVPVQMGLNLFQAF